MKGLMIKDLRLIKNQKFFLTGVFLISAGFLVSGEALSFVVSYVAAILSVLITTTISYDEMDNGYLYLFTMPIDRKAYVMEKYLLGMLALLLLLAAIAALFLFAPVIKPLADQEIGMGEAFLCALLSAVLIQSVAIPIQLKFGSEKSRLALMACVAVTLIGMYSVKHLLDVAGVDLSGGVRQLEQVSPEVLVGCGCIGAVVLLGISCAASVGIMKKKQF